MAAGGGGGGGTTINAESYNRIGQFLEENHYRKSFPIFIQIRLFKTRGYKLRKSSAAGTT